MRTHNAVTVKKDHTMKSVAAAATSTSHEEEGSNGWSLHTRGIVVAIWVPLAVLLYHSDVPTVHASPIDLFARAMMLIGVLLIGPLFVAPCCNQKRYGLLAYTVTHPLTFCYWLWWIA